MLWPTIIMGIIAGVFLWIGYSKGQGQHLIGLTTGGKMLIEILPLLLFSFIVAGMVQALIPAHVVEKWIGAESGFRGIIIGSIAGGLTPGGPFVSFPIVAGMYRAGAGIGTTVAYVTGWSLLAFTRMPLEVGLMGYRFALIRLACTAVFPIIAGYLAQILFSRVSL